ncbi:MAG: pectate lyase [Gammaproteobacteria bacterium]|nr:pectate lyase [Gammaproteobacteria bacterium]
MPIDLPSMDLPHDSRRRAPASHRTRLPGPWLLAACTALIALPALSQTPSSELLAFPGAVGWAAHTPGGRGGQVIRVTTLAAKGPGSFLEALETKGPRVIVFEVGGVIDLHGEEIGITEPYLTVAGQTAPAPGITLIRAGVNILAHDVIIQHIRVRTGTAGMSKRTGWEPDAMGTVGAYNVIVDHCSMTWSVDENLSASGKRFIGANPDEWRQHTSHAITFSNNILAEGLANATHAKGEHSKGSLIHDNVTDILITGNLYAHDAERSPLFKGGVHGSIVNNLIYDPGQRAVHYNLIAAEWGDHPLQVGKISLVGNVMRAGPSTPSDVALFMLGGAGDVELYMKDNIAVDRVGRPLPMLGRYTTSPAKIIEVKTAPALGEGVKVLPAAEVENSVIANAGARPWDRDEHDWRVIADTIEGRGRIIDSEQDVGGYPVQLATHQAFNPADWDMRYMTPKVAPTYKATH